MLKNLLKKFIPHSLLLTYHHALAKSAAFIYGHPSNKMIIIGVTGTNGKSTTAGLCSQILDCLEIKNGLLSTVSFKIDKEEKLNNQKMTMLGRLQTQKMLRKMLAAGCRVVVVETSSQGIEQLRHSAINYDTLVFTNLTPEHIEAHGGFANYRAAKEKLFAHLGNCQTKIIDGKKIAKVIIANSDDPETDRLRQYKVDKFITYSVRQLSDYQVEDINLSDGLSFSIRQHQVKTNLLGVFNVYNSLAALLAVRQVESDWSKLSACQLNGVAGRQEWIELGQDFRAMVDYAPEPEGLKQLYIALKDIPYKKLIHVLGSCGGGRDVSRQPLMGKLAGENADIVIVTNEDPYDDDPQEIINSVASGASRAGKVEGQNLYKILNRQEAITKAVSLAQTGDLVLVTGKGAEQAMCVARGRKIPWDDRQIIRNALK